MAATSRTPFAAFTTPFTASAVALSVIRPRMPTTDIRIPTIPSIHAMWITPVNILSPVIAILTAAVTLNTPAAISGNNATMVNPLIQSPRNQRSCGTTPHTKIEGPKAARMNKTALAKKNANNSPPTVSNIAILSASRNAPLTIDVDNPPKTRDWTETL